MYVRVVANAIVMYVLVVANAIVMCVRVVANAIVMCVRVVANAIVMYVRVGANAIVIYVRVAANAIVMSYSFLARQPPQWAMAASFARFLDHTQRRIKVGRTPLDEGSARRRDLYLTIYNIHNRQTSLSPVGFERTIPASERPQTYVV